MGGKILFTIHSMKILGGILSRGFYQNSGGGRRQKSEFRIQETEFGFRFLERGGQKGEGESWGDRIKIK
jgi:hypothetical protein